MTREPTTDSPEVGLHLGLLWALIRKHLRKIMGYSLGLGVLMGLLSLFVIPKKYEAKAVLLPPGGESLTGGGWIKSLIPGLGGGTSAEIVMALLQSDRVCWSVVRNLRLDTLWNDTVRQKLIQRAQNRLKVESDVTLGTIAVKFRERDPRLAARVVQEFLYVTEQLNDTLKISPIKPFLKVLDPPFPPRKKASPKTSLNVLLTLFLSFLLFSGYYGYRELRKPHIEDCWDLQLVLGEVPCRLYLGPQDQGTLKYPGLRVVTSEKRGFLTWFPGAPQTLLDQVARDLQDLAAPEGNARPWVLEGPLPKQLPKILHQIQPGQEFWVMLPQGKVQKREIRELWEVLHAQGVQPTLWVVVPSSAGG